MTIDQIFAPSSNGQEYSIQDVLAAVGNQYQPQESRGNQSIDEVLRGLTLGYNPVKAPTMPYGVAQYGGGASENTIYTPAAFDKELLTAKYQESAANNAYKDAIAAGRSEAEARQKEAEMKSKYAMAGSLAASYFGLPPMVGSFIGQAVAEPVDDVFNSVADVFGW